MSSVRLLLSAALLLTAVAGCGSHARRRRALRSCGQEGSWGRDQQRRCSGTKQPASTTSQQSSSGAESHPGSGAQPHAVGQGMRASDHQFSTPVDPVSPTTMSSRSPR